MSAASRRSLMRLLVQRADEHDVHLLAEQRLAGLEAHVLEGSGEGAPAALVGLGRGSGTADVMPMPMPGLVP